MDRLNDILPYIREQKCALFIGAGISKIAGCYDWDSVVNDMFAHPIIQAKEIKKEDLTRKFSNEELISYCYQLFIENDIERDYWGIARKAIFFDAELFQKKYLPIVKLLKKINPPTPIITTNIDNCLEYTKEYNLSKIFFKPEHFVDTNLSDGGIFHIHGYYENFEESLLLREKYIERYSNVQFQDFLKGLFRNYSVLFLGYSLRDKEIMDIILSTKNTNVKHFLLIPVEDNLSDSYKTVLFEMYGITSITYGERSVFYNVFKEWIIKNFEITRIGEEDASKPNV